MLEIAGILVAISPDKESHTLPDQDSKPKSEDNTTA